MWSMVYFSAPRLYNSGEFPIPQWCRESAHLPWDVRDSIISAHHRLRGRSKPVGVLVCPGDILHGRLSSFFIASSSGSCVCHQFVTISKIALVNSLAVFFYCGVSRFQLSFDHIVNESVNRKFTIEAYFWELPNQDIRSSEWWWGAITVSIWSKWVEVDFIVLDINLRIILSWLSSCAVKPNGCTVVSYRIDQIKGWTT